MIILLAPLSVSVVLGLSLTLSDRLTVPLDIIDQVSTCTSGRQDLYDGVPSGVRIVLIEEVSAILPIGKLQYLTRPLYINTAFLRRGEQSEHLRCLIIPGTGLFLVTVTCQFDRPISQHHGRKLLSAHRITHHGDLLRYDITRLLAGLLDIIIKISPEISLDLDRLIFLSGFYQCGLGLILFSDRGVIVCLLRLFQGIGRFFKAFIERLSRHLDLPWHLIAIFIMEEIQGHIRTRRYEIWRTIFSHDHGGILYIARLCYLINGTFRLNLTRWLVDRIFHGRCRGYLGISTCNIIILWRHHINLLSVIYGILKIKNLILCYRHCGGRAILGCHLPGFSIISRRLSDPITVLILSLKDKRIIPVPYDQPRLW